MVLRLNRAIAKVADILVEQPTKFEFVINLKAAKMQIPGRPPAAFHDPPSITRFPDHPFKARRGSYRTTRGCPKAQ
jgi:hypothetical protein